MNFIQFASPRRVHLQCFKYSLFVTGVDHVSLLWYQQESPNQANKVGGVSNAHLKLQLHVTKP